jgi:hypothetical protein
MVTRDHSSKRTFDGRQRLHLCRMRASRRESMIARQRATGNGRGEDLALKDDGRNVYRKSRHDVLLSSSGSSRGGGS